MHSVTLYNRTGVTFSFALTDEDWATLKGAMLNDKAPRFIEVYCHDAGTTCGIRVDEYIMYEEREAF